MGKLVVQQVLSKHTTYKDTLTTTQKQNQKMGITKIPIKCRGIQHFLEIKTKINGWSCLLLEAQNNCWIFVYKVNVEHLLQCLWFSTLLDCWHFCIVTGLAEENYYYYPCCWHPSTTTIHWMIISYNKQTRIYCKGLFWLPETLDDLSRRGLLLPVQRTLKSACTSEIMKPNSRSMPYQRNGTYSIEPRLWAEFSHRCLTVKATSKDSELFLWMTL